MMRFFKESTKKLFNHFGYGIYRISSKRITMADFLDHIKKMDFKPQTIIDVGVAYGTFEIYERFPKAAYLLIEPLKEYADAIKKISHKYHVEYVMAAAGPISGMTTFNVHPELMGSSLLKEFHTNDRVPREVPMVTIDSVCSDKGLMGPYLMKIDVQGAELFVLDGATEVLRDSEVVILEVSTYYFMENSPMVYEVINYMKKKGFVVYDIFGCLYRPLDNALASMDIAFVKENGQFRHSHKYTSKQ